MYGKDNQISQKLNIGILFILAICAFSLTLHIIAEGLAYVAVGNGLVLVVQKGHAACEERFLYPCQEQIHCEQDTVALSPPLATYELLFSITPLLPPPNTIF